MKKKVRIIEPADHGDWKTALVRPDKWPTLKPGIEVELIKTWDNFYGRWFKVKTDNGTIYDIETWKAEQIT